MLVFRILGLWLPLACGCHTSQLWNRVRTCSISGFWLFSGRHYHPLTPTQVFNCLPPLLLSTHLLLTWNCALCGPFFQSQSPAMPMCVCNISFLYSYILTIMTLSLRMSKPTLFGRGWCLACRHIEKQGRSARSGLTIVKGFQQAFCDY